MPRLAPPAALCLLAAFAAGCTCRGPGSSPPPERYLAAGPGLSLVVPEVGRAARELAALQGVVSRFPGTAELVALRGAVAGQLGFDPFDPKALEEAGIDPGRGLGAGGWDGTGAPILVLPVGDAGKLEALLARLARDRMGAPDRGVIRQGVREVTVLRQGPQAPPALAYALTASGRVAVLSAGPQGPAAVVAALDRPGPEQLAEAGGWRTAVEALGARYAAVLYGPPAAPRLAGWPWARDGLALGASVSGDAVQLGAALLLGDRLEAVRALSGGGEARKALARLDPEAPLGLRWDGDLAALGRRLLPYLSPGEQAWLAGAGVDPERDLLATLSAGAAAAVSLSPALDLAGPGEELRRDPLRVIRFEAVAEVRDPERLKAALARLSTPGAPRIDPPGSSAAPSTGRLALPSGEVGWTVTGKRLALAGGPPGALDRLRARLDGAGPGFASPTKRAAAALEGGLGGAVLDPGRLVASVHALPEEAFGGGPSGFVLRSVVDRLLDPVSRLSAASARVALSGGALVVALELEPRPGGAP